MKERGEEVGGGGGEGRGGGGGGGGGVNGAGYAWIEIMDRAGDRGKRVAKRID